MSDVPVSYKDRRNEGDTPLRQCQLVQLHLLHVFDAVCKKAGIEYVLESGTLLGAMRHDGFIPWDDDLDVCMRRCEYNKLLKLGKDVWPEDVQLVTPKDIPNTAFSYSKLRDVNSFYAEVRQDMTLLDPTGIFIDVFPCDDVPDVRRGFQRFLIKSCSSPWKRVRYFYNQITPNPFSALVYTLIAEACHIAYVLSRFNLHVLNKIFGSRHYAISVAEGFTSLREKSKMFPLSKHRFEDGEFPVPNDPDAILTGLYGDWRQIPPVEKRPRHARIIDAFRSVKG